MNKFYLLNYNNWTLQPLINAENKSLKKNSVYIASGIFVYKEKNIYVFPQIRAYP